MQKLNYICGDLSEKKFLKELVNLARSTTGNIDQFISNAGYADKKEFGKFNYDDLNRSVQTMTLSFSEIVNLCIEDLKKSSCGRVVVISSFVNKSIGLNNKIFPITAAAKVL